MNTAERNSRIRSLVRESDPDYPAIQGEEELLREGFDLINDMEFALAELEIEGTDESVIECCACLIAVAMRIVDEKANKEPR